MTNRMHQLVDILQKANRAYYQEDREIMSDLEYDKLYDELVELEKTTGVTLSNSPTNKVGYEIVSALQKAMHDIPMLSLDKTKSPEALGDFLDTEKGLLSWKLDGLSIVLKYNEGKLQQAITRGNGTIGEDVTHNAKVFVNIPVSVPHKGSFSLRGEAVIPFADFYAINEKEEVKYKNPRNLCSGAVRQLNSEITAQRRVFFYAFGLLTTDIEFAKKSEQLEWVKNQGFDVALYKEVTADTVVDAVEEFKQKVPTEPIASDGLVLTYDDIKYSESLGATSKFPRDSIAFKWADEQAETTLINIEWSTSRTGLINPIAIFEPVELEGTQVSRASLHNVNILNELNLNPGDKITVYKANMIIPQVAENLTPTGKQPHIPDTCPVCGGKTEIVGDPAVLYCTSPSCDAKKLYSLSHFVGRDAMNIAGLSEQTLEKFIDAGLVNNYLDLFNLTRFEETITQMEGFGQRSFDKLIAGAEKAKDTSLANFIFALGIKHVGLANAKLLCAFFKFAPMDIANACRQDDYMETLLDVNGFGEAIAASLHDYFIDETNMHSFTQALSVLRIKTPTLSSEEGALKGLTFVITGDVNKFDNRKALQAFIEKNSGKVSGSVSAKTSYLINNNPASKSGKNKKAAELGVPIITEDEFLTLSPFQE